MEDLWPEDPRRVGAYRLLKRLGGGGMGQVFLGRSRGGRLVAVKVVRPELAGDRDFRRRFAREVQAARQVGGFYTAHVLDADPEADPPWLATAYIPGPSLQQAVARHGLLPETSLGLLAAGLAEGLAAVHGCGMVHRDLKPGNVLLAEDGPRLIDFGIARAAEDTQLTGTGMVVGTPGFMAPEHIVGNGARPASDVFALGAVLAYAATGRPPFGGGASHAVNYRVVHEEPELTGVPAAYAALIADCLAKDAAKRPEAEEVIDRVPAWERAGTMWLPPPVTTMIDEANPTAPAASADGDGLFFSGDVEIPTPEGWGDDRGRAPEEEADARADRLTRRRQLRRLLAGAETLSGAIADVRQRSQALAWVAAATIPFDAARGRSLAQAALRSAAEATEVLHRVGALADVAKALSGADERCAREAAEQSAALAEGIRGPSRGSDRRDALAAAARGLAAVDPARAESIATTLGESWALAEVAKGMAAKDPARAERIARGISLQPTADRALAQVAEGMAAKDPARAERIARGLAPDSADRVLMDVAYAQAAKDPDRVERIVHQLEGHIERPDAEYLLGSVAEALAGTDPERAMRIAAENGAILLHHVARTAAETAWSYGPERAERFVHAIPDAFLRSSAMELLLLKAAEADPDRAERIARGIADEEKRAKALSTVVQGLLRIDFPRAQRVARGIPARQPGARAVVLTLMATGLTAYDPGRAERLLQEAEAIVAGLTDAVEHDSTLAGLAPMLASADPARAAGLARRIREPNQRAIVLINVARSVAPAMPERATALFEEAARAARDITEPKRRGFRLVHIVKSAAPRVPQCAVALALEAAREIDDVHRRNELARAIADCAPEVAARVAAHTVHIARRADRNGDEYNIYGRGSLILLVQVDPRQAAELALSHGPAGGPDRALSELVEELTKHAGRERERLESEQN